MFSFGLLPWAYAHGYLLPPLRGSNRATSKLAQRAVMTNIHLTHEPNPGRLGSIDSLCSRR
jgi:hypothetical protein